MEDDEGDDIYNDGEEDVQNSALNGADEDAEPIEVDQPQGEDESEEDSDSVRKTRCCGVHGARVLNHRC